jgi:TRAP-type transport system periplasmic protein
MNATTRAGAVTPTITPTSEVKPITLVFQAFDSEDSIWGKVFGDWFQDLETYSSGRVKVETHWNGELVNPSDVYDAVTQGTLDIDTHLTSMPAGRFPMDDISHFASLGVTTANYSRVQWELYKEFPEMRAPYNDVKVIWVGNTWPNPLGTTANFGLVTKLADNKGMKEVAWGNWQGQLGSALGRVGVALSPSDTYSAFDKGVADGMQANMAFFRSQKFGEVLPNITLMAGPLDAWSVIMNKAKFNSLPADIRQYINNSSETLVDAFDAECLKEYQWDMATYPQQFGSKFIKIPDYELPKWNAARQPVFNQFVNELNSMGLPGTRLMSEWQRLEQQYTINLTPTDTILSSNTNPAVYGQPLMLSANVSALPPEAGTPTGTVDFYAEGNLLASANLSAAGQATCTTSSLLTGSYAITAFYSGDENFTASSSPPLIQMVNPPADQNVLNISIKLQGGARPEAGWIVPLTIKLFTPGLTSPTNVLTATPVYTFNLTTAKNGSTAAALAAGIIPGTYDISASTPGCLMNVKRGVVITGPTAIVSLGTLLAGNANGDNKISIQGFGILAGAYGQGSGETGYDERADFDRSGRVNIADFGLLAANYADNAPLEIIELKYYTNDLPETGSSQEGQIFADIIFKASKGRIQITVYPAAQLGGVAETLDLLQSGAADMAALSCGTFPSVFPLQNLQDLALTVCPDWVTATRVRDELTLSGYLHGFEDLQFLAWNTVRPMDFWLTRKVTQAEDFFGLRIRPRNPVQLVPFTAFGVITVAMSIPDVYIALERGFISGALNSPENARAYKWYEYCQYGLMQPAAYTGTAMVMSKSRWDSLPADVKQILIDALPAWRSQTTAYYQDYENSSLETITLAGTEIYTLDPAEAARWQQLTAPVIASEAERVENSTGLPAQAMVKKLNEINAKYTN